VERRHRRDLGLASAYFSTGRWSRPGSRRSTTCPPARSRTSTRGPTPASAGLSRRVPGACRWSRAGTSQGRARQSTGPVAQRSEQPTHNPSGRSDMLTGSVTR